MEYQYRELTWEDMRLVDRVLDKMIDDDVAGKLPEEMSDEEYYTEDHLVIMRLGSRIREIIQSNHRIDVLSHGQVA